LHTTKKLQELLGFFDPAGKKSKGLKEVKRNTNASAPFKKLNKY
jgi:hypothetical protein